MVIRRLLIVSAVLVAIVSLIATAVCLLPRYKPGITHENFLLLRQGMSQEEVEAILDKKQTPDAEFANGDYIVTWEHGYKLIEIGFDKKKRVADGVFYPNKLNRWEDTGYEYLATDSHSITNRYREWVQEARRRIRE